MGQSTVQLPESEKLEISTVLSILLTWGLNEGIDEICKGSLTIVPPADVGVGFSRSFLGRLLACIHTNHGPKIWFDFLVYGL